MLLVVLIPDDSKYNQLQGILTSSYSPFTSTKRTYCSIYIYINLSSRAAKFELLHSSGLTGSIIISSESFRSTANAGDTVVVNTTSGSIDTSYTGTSASAVYSIKYDGKYFYRMYINYTIIFTACIT